MWDTARGEELGDVPAIAEQKLEAMRMVWLDSLTDVNEPVKFDFISDVNLIM